MPIYEDPTAAYGDEIFTAVTDVKVEGEALKSGSLYDTAAGGMTVGDVVSLYSLCPAVDGVRVYALISDNAFFAQEAATALTLMCEAAYRQTGMRVHLRTATHMDDTYVGYTDYLSYRSVRIGYYESAYYAFDDAKTKPLADFISANAHRYGFIDLSAEGDAGHFRYIGIPHATVMKDKGLSTLAEYHAFLRGRTCALKITLGDANYYIQSFDVAEGSATVKVPNQYKNQYELSATGNGSAVMTVKVYESGLGHPLPYVASGDADRSKTVICLDAGHGAHDPGAVWPQTGDPTYCEKDYNLAVTLKAKEYLEAMGYTVILTRDDDTFVELGDRVSFAKKYGTDLFVSLHCNSTDHPNSPTAVGPQVYFYDSKYTNYLNHTIAQTFRNAINTGTAEYIGAGVSMPVEEGDVRHGEYTVISDLNLPSVLIEMGFITNEGDRALFEDEAWRESMGYSVAMAVEKLFANDQLGIR